MLVTVKELVMSQSATEIAAALLDKFSNKPENTEQGMKRLLQFIENLCQIEPVDSGHLILGVIHTGEEGEFLDPCLYCKEEITASFREDSELSRLNGIEGLSEEEIKRLAQIRDFPSSYAFEFSPWNEILGYEVDMQNACEVGAAALCAAVLWEMTFFGLDEAQVEEERRKLDELLREAEKLSALPEEEREKHYTSAEEFFAKWGFPEPTEEERRESKRRLYREILINNLRTYRALEKYMESAARKNR